MQTIEQTAENTWRAYTAAWSIPDEEQRARTLTELVSAEVEYTNPNIRSHGRAELSGYMKGFQAQLPGGAFRLDTFHFRNGESLAKWSKLNGAGETVVRGESFGRYDDAGQLVKMAGFLPIT